MNLAIKQLTVFSILLSLSLLLFVVSASAAGVVPAPTGGESPGDYSLDDFIVLFINIANWILGIVGSLALLMFIYGGVTMIFSGGNDQVVSRGKQILLNSIIGLVIVFSSYTIIQFAGSALLPSERQNILNFGWFKNR